MFESYLTSYVHKGLPSVKKLVKHGLSTGRYTESEVNEISQFWTHFREALTTVEIDSVYLDYIGEFKINTFKIQRKISKLVVSMKKMLADGDTRDSIQYQNAVIKFQTLWKVYRKICSENYYKKIYFQNKNAKKKGTKV